MDEIILAVRELFTDFSNEINGITFLFDKPRVASVIKDDILLEYQFGSREEETCFLFACPLNIEELMFKVYPKGKFAVFVDLEKMKDIRDYTVFIFEYDKSKQYLTALFNDYEYKSILNEYLGKWSIHYEKNTLVVRLKKGISPLFGTKVTVNDLLMGYKVILETKKVLEYFNRKI